jgi:hypothetical protein
MQLKFLITGCHGDLAFSIAQIIKKNFFFYFFHEIVCFRYNQYFLHLFISFRVINASASLTPFCTPLVCAKL